MAQATPFTVEAMIDIHTHVLHGIDDGPDDTVGSVAMAHLAAERGTRTLVATPHVRGDHKKVVVEEIQERARTLNRLVRDYGIDVFIVPGGEVGLSRALEMSDEQLELVTLGGNGRDLLIESPYGQLPSVFESLLDTLVQRGFRITLAHPELNPSFQADPERLGRLAADGVVVQVTSASLTGRRSAARALAMRALANGWVSIIATDAHSAEWRPPDLNPGLQAARRALPGAADEIEWMVTEAPLAIVQGRDLPPRPARRAGGERRGLWKRFVGRSA
jgi:protein-tyrosine phosphatase